MFSRLPILVYGIAAYCVGFASLVYMIGWLGNFLVPISIDSQPTQSLAVPLAINTVVFLVFCVQHSVMARPKFKERWTKVIPESAERATYVLFSGVALFVVMLCWQPLGGHLWNIENQPIRCTLHTLYVAGWAILVGSTFALNHFDLFGLRQVWLQFRGKPYTPLKFATPGPYKLVRHPLYVGWLTLAWATPSMSIAHLAFALATTAYILKAIRWEEIDLIEMHGDTYRSYQRQTPMLIPNSLPAKKTASIEATSSH